MVIKKYTIDTLGKKTTQHTTNSSNSEKFLNKWIRRVAVARNFTHHPGE